MRGDNVRTNADVFEVDGHNSHALGDTDDNPDGDSDTDADAGADTDS